MAGAAAWPTTCTTNVRAMSIVRIFQLGATRFMVRVAITPGAETAALETNRNYGARTTGHRYRAVVYWQPVACRMGLTMGDIE